MARTAAKNKLREDFKWAAEKRTYEKVFYSILNRRTSVHTIGREEDELGYTTPHGDIYLAPEHDYIDVLQDDDRPFFRYGVFAHEMLHQAFTDFEYLRKVLEQRTDDNEKRVLSLFFNLVEDASIEYFAPEIFGGTILKALRFSIGHIYDCSPKLEELTSPFGQLVAALVNFGDLGLLKGEFTFPEAEEYFAKIAPEFDRLVTSTDPRSRVDAAEKWMILTRPLWRKESELEDLLRKLASMMSGGSDGGQPLRKPEGGESNDDETAKRRRAFAAALAGAVTPDEGEGNGSGSGENGDEDGSPADAASERSDGAGEGEEGAGSETGSGGAETDGETGKDAFGSESGNGNDDREGDEEGGSEGDKPEADVKAVLVEYRDDGSTPVAAYGDEGAYDDMRRQIERELKALEESDKDTLDLPVIIPNIANKGGTMKVSCLNVLDKASENDREGYKEHLEGLREDIRLLTNSLQTIFRCDNDVYVRKTAGKYNIERDLAHTTVRVFDRKLEKKNVSDMAVMMLVDCSGSMAGRKISLARDAAIVLTETFKALNIPVYVMGFTADTNHYDVTHIHYVSWTNTADERASLMHIGAFADNDDGYSIRYASELLKKKRAEHKIVFVISDGAPACWRYSSSVNGIADTSLAIRDAKKVAAVFGIGIGRVQYGDLKAMYQGSYLSISDVSTLTKTLARQLKVLIRRF